MKKEKWEGANEEADFMSQFHPEQYSEVMAGMSTLMIELEDAKTKMGFLCYTGDEKFTGGPFFEHNRKITAEFDSFYAKKAYMNKMGLVPICFTFWDTKNPQKAVFVYVSLNILPELKKFFGVK